MFVKITFVLLIGCIAVMAGPIDDMFNGIQNAAEIPNEVANQAGKAFNKGFDIMKDNWEKGLNTAQNFAKQGVEGADNMYKNVQENFQKGVNSAQNFAKQGVETGISGIKDGAKIFAFIPEQILQAFGDKKQQ